MRNILIFIVVVVIYYALKTVFRSAVKAYHEEEKPRARLMGEDMVLDPQCRTYVPKSRSVTRRVDGKLTYFCSESCARAYEEQNRA